jgi:predicted HicB family RNase H-like nuclease
VAVVNVKIDDELHRRVNAQRSLSGLKLYEYVEEALREKVERDEAARAQSDQNRSR